MGWILVDDEGREIRERDGQPRIRVRRLHNGTPLFSVLRSIIHEQSPFTVLGLLGTCPGCRRPWFERYEDTDRSGLKPYMDKRRIWNRCVGCYKQIERQRTAERRDRQWKVWTKKDPDTWWTIEHFQRGRKSQWRVKG